MARCGGLRGGCLLDRRGSESFSRFALIFDDVESSAV